MKKLTLITLPLYALVTITTLTFSSVQAKELLLGEAVDMGALKSIKQLMAEPEKYSDKKVTIKGTIKKVCTVKGCWADFFADDTKLRVKVKDGKVVIPIHAIDREAYATGIFTAKKLNKEKTIAYKKHMAEDAGEEFDPKSVTKGMILYQLKSNAVKVL